MDVTARLTVFFEDPFWVGVYERRAGPLLEAAKVTFVKEPTDGQVYEFFLSHFSRLRFGAVLAPQSQPQRRPNPKRMQREAARALLSHGVGTKAQQAVSAQREEAGRLRQALRRDRALEEKERRFALRTQKRKEKHRGR